MPAATLTRTAKTGTGRTRAARAAGDRLNRGSGRLSDRVGERLKIICGRAGWLRDLEPNYLPAERRRQSRRVPGAQVVAVRFCVRRERAEHRGGL